MEFPYDVGDETPERVELPLVAPPTELDRANYETRKAISERMEREYMEVFLLAYGAFGPGYVPSGRHYLVEKEEEEKARRTGERAKIAATVFSVKDEAGNKRHFTVGEDGKVTECADYKEGFGDKLLEPHPTQGFMHKGQFCRIHRFSLCWGGYELYSPMTAEQLAKLRVSRKTGKARRAIEKDMKDHPLFHWQEPDQAGS